MWSTPTFLIDEARCRRNIRLMAERARRAGVRLRPHAKTHQSTGVAEWFREAGVTQLTVSSLDMARYFAAAGWTDITVAFPSNIREIDTINELAGRIRLLLVVEAPEVVAFLAERVSAPLELMIKVDIGYGRTGLATTDLEQLNTLITAIESSAQLTFRGFLGHAGHSYGARGEAEIVAVHHESLGRMQQLYDHYRARFPELVISVGDTPTCSPSASATGTPLRAAARPALSPS